MFANASQITNLQIKRVSMKSHYMVYELILMLYRLPYLSHVPMSDYFTFQTTDISIRYRLLQTYNKSYKIIKIGKFIAIIRFNYEQNV